MQLAHALFATAVAIAELGIIAPAQTPQLVADINKTPAILSSLPGLHGDQLWNFGAFTYFTATTTTHGRQLYRTLGTSATTARLTALDPGVGFSRPTYLAVLGTQLFFSGQGSTGEELYAMDLTSPVPTARLVKDIAPGSKDSAPQFLTAFKGFVYFRAWTSASGHELWRTDGTATNTTLVKDIAGGASSSTPMGFTEYKGHLYFAATEKTSGYELWRTDGTSAGTVRFADINRGVRDSMPAGFAIYKNQLYFSAATAAAGAELHRTDGLSVSLVHDVRSGPLGSSPWHLLVFKGFLYFAARTTSAGRELCRTDGAKLSVFDLATGSISSDPQGLQLVGSGSNQTLAMRAFRSSTGHELVFHDGTKNTFIDVYPGSTTSFPMFLLGTQAGVLYFRGIGSNAAGMELWRSDGTAAGTKLVKDINPKPGQGSIPAYLTLSPLGQVLFAANDSVHGVELWTSDGTTAGTKMVADINSVPTNQGSRPTHFVDANGTLYLAALDGPHGAELWRSDGTSAGTRLVQDIFAGTIGSGPHELLVIGKKLFFAALTPANGTELHCLNLTNDRITLIDVVPGARGSFPYQLTAYRGKCFFGAVHATASIELFCSDGTPAGTRMVKDIRSGNQSATPQMFVEHLGKLYFSAHGPANGTELWVTDGTTNGTKEAVDVWKGSSSSYPSYITSLGSVLMFAATATAGQELYISDGTSAGTRMFDIRKGPIGSRPSAGRARFVQVGGNVYFSADDGINGRELFVYDGTSVKITRDIYAGTLASSPSAITAVGNRVVFRANNAFGLEMWASDGTSAGTILLKDIFPGPGHARPDSLTSIGKRRVLFAATRSHFDGELYVTDGTPAGTRRLADINPGRLGSFPSGFTVLNDTVLFQARHPMFGSELFRIDLHGVSQPRGIGCRAGNSDPVLDSTDPVLGRNLTLSLRRAAPSRSGMLLVGFRARASQLLTFPGGCTTYLDFTQPFLPLAFRTDTSGSWSLNVAIPNDPRSVGRVFSLQAGIGPTATPPLGIDLTNLLILDFGR